MAGQAMAGVQSHHILSTVKHFALNAQETGRVVLDARIARAALREADLLAFEIAIEQGHPGCVMCAYNQVNGAYACENDWLLEPGAEAGLALSGLRDVRLGRGPFRRAGRHGRPRPGIGRAARQGRSSSASP